MLRIYFGERVLLLTPEETPGAAGTATVDSAEALRAAALSFHRSEKARLILNMAAQCDTTLLLEGAFRLIRTGGGVVRRADGALLLIHRRGVWDLPKGWIDPGETLEACAVREVEEETGVTGLTVTRPLLVTYHTYEDKGGLVLKENHWFAMETTFEGALRPQTEEDIAGAEWVTPSDLDRHLAHTHPSIRDVLQFYLGR
ncbi:NUDIX hydrolase [Flaviaesturariibacter amylovorans]|uniref:NUDIX domain-containing protein n=1 Tax=Flaviaesturariibacter amylovorans TaxID=1084520 RepID=A0ABP8GX21_9BACT